MENIDNKKRSHPFRTLFFLLILIITLIIIYGYFLGNSGLIIKEYEITDSKFVDSFENFKIAHFSDIMYKSKDDIEIFDEIIEKINDKKPDLIIFSGNLSNGKYKFDEQEAQKIIDKLSQLSSNYGKYYVSGENDKKNPNYDSIMQKSGFISLNDTKDNIFSSKKEQILLVGLDNNTSNEFITDIIKENENIYKIVIFSESDEIDEIKDYNFNLALSSNSLNGQIDIPIVKEFFLRDGSTKYFEPYYKVNNTDLYISSGIGTDKIDFRLFNKPSFNFYKIKK